MKRMFAHKGIVDEVNAGIEAGEITIPEDVYEYDLTAIETGAIVAGLLGSADFAVTLGIEKSDAISHSAVRIKGTYTGDAGTIDLEMLLVELAQAKMNGELAKYSYVVVSKVGFPTGDNDFNVALTDNLDGNPTLYCEVAQSGGATKYKHICKLQQGITAGATAPLVYFFIEVINETQTTLTLDDIKLYIGANILNCEAFGASGDKVFGLVRCGVENGSFWAQASYTQATITDGVISFSKVSASQGLLGTLAISEQVCFEI